ncbi:hypothetical protein BDF20DRAFT_876239 [Mycotypha africana]|uniref:uncharacterized protein n=1 Tax=Mycotypha africana TaxID=64632 RepID=UPI00230009BF|nr:uncharacterized protein BDF20DRAFT_876239 [Mycotypha africana]KAI8977674.1 hypothetical protein BDF20DRAFT_876239 [Mycotypha africana]
MVTWFFENNHFTNAWIPFDRKNQKKLEYVYRHHEEFIKHMKDKETEVSESLQQQDTTIASCNATATSPTTVTSSTNAQTGTAITNIPTTEINFVNNHRKAPTMPTIPKPVTIKDIDSDEEDSSVHSSIQYGHNCLYIKLIDSHFEQPITLYPALLLGSLPERDFLIIRAEMTDHKQSQNEHFFFLDDV